MSSSTMTVEQDAVEAVAPQVRMTDAQTTNATMTWRPASGPTSSPSTACPGGSPSSTPVSWSSSTGSSACTTSAATCSRSAPRSARAPSCWATWPARPRSASRCATCSSTAGDRPRELPVVNHWYADVTEKAFLEEYERFHEQPPDVIVGLSEGIDAEERAGTCRIVHVDGGHRTTSCAVTWPRPAPCSGPGASWPSGTCPPRTTRAWRWPCGSWCSAGVRAPLHHRVQALRHLGQRRPRLAGAGIDAWVAGRPDLGTDIHALAGWPVRRLFGLDRPSVDPDLLVRIPDLDAMPGPEEASRPPLNRAAGGWRPPRGPGPGTGRRGHPPPRRAHRRRAE